MISPGSALALTVTVDSVLPLSAPDVWAAVWAMAAADPARSMAPKGSRAAVDAVFLAGKAAGLASAVDILLLGAWCWDMGVQIHQRVVGWLMTPAPNGVCTKQVSGWLMDSIISCKCE